MFRLAYYATKWLLIAAVAMLVCVLALCWVAASAFVWIVEAVVAWRRHDGMPTFAIPRSSQDPKLGRTAVAMVGVLGVLVLLGSVTGSSPTTPPAQADAGTSAAATSTEAAEPSAPPTTDAAFSDAEQAADDDHYAKATTIALALGSSDADRIDRKISRRLAARALAAVSRGDRSTARSLLRQASLHADTPQARSASRRLAVATTAAAARRRAASWTSCDASIRAKVGSTTCPFAENVFWSYYEGGEASEVTAWSPATARDYDLTCRPDALDVSCTAEDGAAVRFAASAVDAYSDDQAAAYAASHDTGAAPTDDDADADDASDDASGCDGNYTGCVPAGQGDVDCPDVDGPVEVLGVDVDRLDGDGDGVACDNG